MQTCNKQPETYIQLSHTNRNKPGGQGKSHRDLRVPTRYQKQSHFSGKLAVSKLSDPSVLHMHILYCQSHRHTQPLKVLLLLFAVP